MKIKNRHLRRLCYFAPVFCSIAVLSTQLQAGPTIQLNGDESRDGMADSGNLGYVGGNTRIGVSIDRELQGQVDINQIIQEDDSSATSAEGWFGYKLKDDDNASKGFQGGGVKLNHQWVNDDADAVHKVFGAYDRNTDDLSKATVGYGQETEDVFWSGHVSKSMGDDVVSGDVTTRVYDYGVGGEVGTFFDSTLTRVRGGLDYEFGTEYSDNEDRPSRTTVSAGVEQFFHDTPHSVTLDVSAYQKSGGDDAEDTDFNARLGYRYEFGGNGAFQSEETIRRRRVEIPGTPGRPGRAGVPAIPATPAIAGNPARPAQAAIPAKYERRAIQTPGHEFVKTTMKLENETFFKLNSSALTHSAKRNLDKIVSQIRGHGYLGAIRITGNTCGMGDPVYDQRLSENRANAVRDYLLDQGFNPEHLIARGLGKGSPKYDRNDNDFKNRRVDLEYVTERSIRKQSHNKVQYKNVLIQEGRPAIPAQPARPGRAGHPGRAAIPAIAATPGTPSRFVWKTEVVKSAPIWIKRALRNTIRHNKTISTYTTRSSQKAVDDSYTLTDKNGLFDVLNNDSDGVTLVSFTQPSNGTVVREGDLIRYTPNPGFSGSDSFTYTVVDKDGNEITATVNIEVPTVVNNAPTAVADVATTNENTEIAIRVLDNDIDIDNGDSFTITGTTNPANGSVSIVGDHIVYTPDTDFSGTDTFDYTITDTSGNTSTSTVTVTVSNVNEPPKATDDNVTTSENTAITIDAITNDIDPDGDALVISTVSDPSHGSATIVNNEIVYTPEAGYSGSDSFTYTITDGEGHNVTATINVTVEATGSNTAPAANDDVRTTDQDTPITISVMSNDSDPDGDSIALTDTTDPEHGSITLAGADIVYTPDSGYTGTDTFTYTITDSNGSTATATVTITVGATGSNSAPTAVDDTRTTNEDTPVTISVMGNDSDSDGDTFSITATTDPKDGTVSISGDNIVYTPNSGYTGTDTFTYTITDSNGSTATATVTVTVEAAGSNTAPTAFDDARTTNEDTPVTIPVMGNDSDPDGDTISITAITDPKDGTVSISGDNIVYTPNSGYTGTDTFTYTITDSNGSTATATVTITVESVNTAPAAVNDSRTTNEDTPVTIAVMDNDSDPEGDTLSLVSTTPPLNGGAVISGANIIYTPNSGFVGTDLFDYTITDSQGNTVTASVIVTVEAVNTAPVAADDTQSTSEDTAVTISVLSNDSDPDGDTISISAITDPKFGTVSQSGDDIIYTPNTGYTGTDTFTYTITDPNGSTSTATVNVTVSAVNNAPVAADDTQSTHEDTAVTIPVLSNDSDPDGDTISISAITDPKFGTVSQSGGDIIYTPNTGYIGTDTFTYTITDPSGSTSTATVDITITANQPPVAIDDTATTDYETEVTIPVANNDYDPDGTTTCVTNIATPPSNGSVSILTTGTDISYTPNTGFSGTDSFVYTACDAEGATSTATVTVTVSPDTGGRAVMGNNSDPVIATIPAFDAPAGTTTSLNIASYLSDSDGDSVYIAIADALGGDITYSGTTLYYTPTDASAGQTGTIYITVSDANGGTADSVIRVNVK